MTVPASAATIPSAAPSYNILEVIDLKVEFTSPAGPVRAIDGLSFRVRPGSAVALVGESGSGKSVTAQAILGILPKNGRITGGAILFHDDFGDGPPKLIDLASLPADSARFRALRGGRISMIFQEPMTSLAPVYTIGNQIGEALALHRPIGPLETQRLVIDMLTLVGFPDPARAYDTYPFELSGGLRQRAMIAMALVCRPSLLIADEPTTALDVTIQAQILELIQKLRVELDMAVLLITHDLGIVANIAEEVVVMYRGQVMERGEMRELFADPRHPYLKALLGAVPRFDMAQGERLKPLREIRVREGKMLRADAAAGRRAAQRHRPILEVRHLGKSFTIRKGKGWFGRGRPAPVKAVDDVGFVVRRGACFGLVGESGCGKTTVSKIIMRAVAADEGEVLFDDGGQMVDLLRLEAEALNAVRRKIQYVFQDPFSSLDPRMTVFDLVREPLVIHGLGNDDEQRELVGELMELVGLDRRYLNRYPHSFSGGQRQRIGIARALALKPDLLICDEPVSALDVSVQAQILNLLKDLQRELGLTYIFISHNLAVVDYMADVIAVMCAGQIVEQAPRQALFRRPVHPYTRALLAAVPYPDPAHPLDFRALAHGRASTPALWPWPFSPDPAGPAPLLRVGEDHFVRAHAEPAVGVEALL